MFHTVPMFFIYISMIISDVIFKILILSGVWQVACSASSLLWTNLKACCINLTAEGAAVRHTWKVRLQRNNWNENASCENSPACRSIGTHFTLKP